ncbi:MAG: TolC family protein [candidate division Zixibacteria bacterium]|nr:TolC family protein [candidate division Zixibacteria bacterium]
MNLQLAENKPNLTVAGGFKRAQADGTNSFVFGLAMPLPFFDRGQGSTKALRSEGVAAGWARQQAQVSTRVEYRRLTRNLKQFSARRKMFNDIILPQAQETYRSLRQAFEKGKVIYSVLLQGEQTLIELRAELNDLDLALVEQVIALEQLLGVHLLMTQSK